MIPFLGAGANLGTRPAGAVWDENTVAFLPRGDELSLWLADIVNFPSAEWYDRADLAKVSSYYAEISARDRLLGRLRGVFRRDSYAPCPIHIYLAELAKSAEIARDAGPALSAEYGPLKPEEFKPLLIVTTNYDDLTETALQALGCAYDLVVHPTDHKEHAGSIMWWQHGAGEPVWCHPNQLMIDLETTTVVYKMHGTVSRALSKFDSYVITEEDYIEFLSRMMSHEAIPPLFTAHFYTRQFLFLGYGLRDWNLRLMLRNLDGKLSTKKEKSGLAEAAAGKERGELTSWAIQKGPSLHESFLWSARDVAILDEDLNEFVKGLWKHSTTLVCGACAKR